MESDEIENKNDKDRSNISIKKSSFNGLIIALLVIGVAAAFFAGSYLSNLNSKYITQEELDDVVAKLELKMLQSQLPTNQPKQPLKISIDDDPVRGNQNAPITIIEFSDFQCPFCARFHVQTLPLLLEEYINPGKVNLVYRDFPIQSSHPNALPAAVAAECADEQEMYWEFHDKLLENQNQWNRIEAMEAITVFNQYASELGLNQDQFNSCISGGKYLDEVRNDLKDGREYGITGTPGFFIGNEKIGFVELKGAQPFESFKKVIDVQLNS